MYIKRVRYKDGDHYILGQTYRENGDWRHRDLMDLGWNPAEYIKYPGGNGFYFSQKVEETLMAQGVEYSAEELEDAFLPFLKYRVRRIVEAFRDPDTPLNVSRACPREKRWNYLPDLHPFDIRRLHFLKFGRIDMGDLGNRPWKFLNVLLCKSRDEIEATIDRMEQLLRPQEIRPYIFTALHLQACFPQLLTRNHPGALDPEKLDSHFMEEICRLNHDLSFFRGVGRKDRRRLHPYLVKYVVLYFDAAFEPYGGEDFLRGYFGQHHFHRKLLTRTSMTVQESCTIFGISPEKFQRMHRNDLMRAFRRLAKKMHPDHGGNHAAFIRLTEAYEVLLARK